MRSVVEARQLQRFVLPKLTRVRNRHVLLLDLFCFCVTPVIALLLRLEGTGGLERFGTALVFYTILGLLIRPLAFFLCGMYNRYWQSATAEDLAHLLFASVASTAAIAGTSAITSRVFDFHVGVPLFLVVLDGVLSLFVTGATRTIVRLASRPGDLLLGEDARPALIVGAGIVGEQVARELRASPHLGLRPVAFLDDDPNKLGLRVQNIPVVGPRSYLVQAAAEFGATQIIIALPEASGKVIRETLEWCETAGVQARTIPNLSEILSGRVLISKLRRVEIEDVLRREPIETNTDAVRNLIRGRRVLVTGAGGSIGSEICRQVYACGPAEIGLLGHGENSIFELFTELNRPIAASKRNNGHRVPVLRPIIADIRSATRLRNVVSEFCPDIILHAAAHKHVPLMEENPTEAVSNNILGTKNLLDVAVEAGVEHLVLISTDKVVKPTSVMGASKRAAEMLVLQAAQRTGRHYVAVRFGNVLGSRGSVIPIFRRQIATGGPVTVSHPDMTRYFITIPEAVQLVLQAAVLGNGGEIFMLDMGEPVKIVDLARDLIELSGLEVGRDIDIVYTGIRPGEKLKEELFVEGEVYEPTCHDKIRIVKNAGSFVPSVLDDLVRTFTRSVQEDDPDLAMQAFSALLPAINLSREAVCGPISALGHSATVLVNDRLTSVPGQTHERLVN